MNYVQSANPIEKCCVPAYTVFRWILCNSNYELLLHSVHLAVHSFQLNIVGQTLTSLVKMSPNQAKLLAIFIHAYFLNSLIHP